MLPKIFQFIELVKYYLRSENIYKIHSPYLYQWVKHIIEDKRHFYAYEDIENLRKKLLQDERVVEIEDLGAGSLISKTKRRKIKTITNYSSSSPYKCRLLFRIVNYHKPKTILELGTNLGISSLYMSRAMPPTAKITTIEGAYTIAKLAEHHLKVMKAKNIFQVIGNFDNILAPTLTTMGRLDMVFIDGNHRREPTLKYFKMCLEHSHEGSIFIFDDIYWSIEMKEAWKEIKTHQKVKYSLDLYFFGIVLFKNHLFKKQIEKTIIPKKFKPLQWGFWG